MNTNETWETLEGKMLELRILTNADWRHQGYELAALGERVLRSVEMAKSQSPSTRSNMENRFQSADQTKEWMAV